MELAEVALAGTPEAQALLADLPPYDAQTALSEGERLRAAGHPVDLVASVLTQSRLRTRVRDRWGEIADHLVLTPDGAEQATRPVVAAHRARRACAGGLTSIADLGCGLGLDAAALAQAGLHVVAVDSDPATAAAATLNVRALGLTAVVDVTCADVHQLSMDDLRARVDGAFADPARRSGGRRLTDPKTWSPPLSWVLALPFENLAVKVAPGLADELVPAGSEFEVVSVNGQVVEGALYRGALRQGVATRRATLLPGGITITDHDLSEDPPPVASIGRYLWEPDAAVIRAGLVGVVVQQVRGALIDPQIAYVTTDHDVSCDLATRYEVTDVLPFNLKKLRELLRERAVGSVTIKKRGFAATPETIRKQLRLDRTRPGRATVVLTRVATHPMAILVEPATP